MDHSHGQSDAEVAAPPDSVLESALPDRRVTDLSPLDGEGRCDVFAVRTDGGDRFVLKYATDDAVLDLSRELAVANYVSRETSVPVAAPVTHGIDDAGATGYLLSRWAEGQALDETLSSLPPHVRPQVFASAGEVLGRLHAETAFERPGEIEPAAPDSFGIERTADWPELFARELADHVEAVQGTRFEAVAEEVWAYVSDRLRELDTGESPVLLHGDIGEGNVVYDGTEVSCVLDWERSFVGHPEYDLCRAEVRYFLNNWGRESREQAMLYSGYRSERDIPDGFDDRRQCYLATFYLLPLERYQEWAPAVTDDLDGFADRVAQKVRDIME